MTLCDDGNKMPKIERLVITAYGGKWVLYDSYLDPLFYLQCSEPQRSLRDMIGKVDEEKKQKLYEQKNVAVSGIVGVGRSPELWG